MRGSQPSAARGFAGRLARIGQRSGGGQLSEEGLPARLGPVRLRTNWTSLANCPQVAWAPTGHSSGSSCRSFSLSRCTSTKRPVWPIAWASAMTTSWQVVCSETPQTTRWMPSTHTFSSMAASPNNIPVLGARQPRYPLGRRRNLPPPAPRRAPDPRPHWPAARTPRPQRLYWLLSAGVPPPPPRPLAISVTPLPDPLACRRAPPPEAPGVGGSEGGAEPRSPPPPPPSEKRGNAAAATRGQRVEAGV